MFTGSEVLATPAGAWSRSLTLMAPSHSQFPVVLTWVEALKSCLTLWQSCWLFASTPSAAATCASASLLWAVDGSPGNSDVGYSMHSFVAEYDIIWHSKPGMLDSHPFSHQATEVDHIHAYAAYSTFPPIASSRLQSIQCIPWLCSPSRGLRKVMLHCQILGLLMKQFLCGGDHCVIQAGFKGCQADEGCTYGPIPRFAWSSPKCAACWDLPSNPILVCMGMSVPAWEWAEWGPSVVIYVGKMVWITKTRILTCYTNVDYPTVRNWLWRPTNSAGMGSLLGQENMLSLLYLWSWKSVRLIRTQERNGLYCTWRHVKNCNKIGTKPGFAFQEPGAMRQNL